MYRNSDFRKIIRISEKTSETSETFPKLVCLEQKI